MSAISLCCDKAHLQYYLECPVHELSREQLKEKLRLAEEALGIIAKAYIEDEEKRPTSEWSMGNYDDVFSDGIKKGEHYQAEVARNALLKLRGGKGA